MTKCPRFFRCEEHWSPEELAEMKPLAAEEKQPTDEVREMTRCAFGRMMVVMLVIMMGGCAAMEPPASTKKTTTTTNQATGDVTTIEETPVVTPGFFESGNYNNYLEFEGRRGEKHTSAAEKQIDAIYKAGMELLAHCTTALEKGLASAHMMDQIARVQLSAAPSGVHAPKTMADVFDQNLTGWLGTALRGWEVLSGSRTNKSDVSTMNVTADRGSKVLVGSSGNNVQDYTLSANGAAGYISGIEFNAGLDYRPVSTSTKGRESYGLSF